MIARRSWSRVSPAAAVQDVLLQEREERFHGRVVAACSGPAPRSGQPAGVQQADVGVGAELLGSEWMMTVPAGERSEIALRSADTASDAFIRLSIE